MAKLVCRWRRQMGGRDPEQATSTLANIGWSSHGTTVTIYGLPSKVMGVRDMNYMLAGAQEAIWTIFDENGVTSQKSKIRPKSPKKSIDMFCCASFFAMFGQISSRPASCNLSWWSSTVQS